MRLDKANHITGRGSPASRETEKVYHPVTKEQWNAILSQDKGADGSFCYGLRTTKKFCRPSCPKRSYDPRRIVVFDSADAALAAGYRPCTRCRPDRPDWTDTKTELARAAEGYLRGHYADRFSLSAFAAATHVNKAHLARTFKSVYGCTLLERCNQLRCERAAELLKSPELSVSYIAGAVGYVSASHFTQVFRRTVGQTPTEYRSAYFRLLEKEAAVKE